MVFENFAERERFLFRTVFNDSTKTRNCGEPETFLENDFTRGRGLGESRRGASAAAAKVQRSDKVQCTLGVRCH